MVCSFDLPFVFTINARYIKLCTKFCHERCYWCDNVYNGVISLDFNRLLKIYEFYNIIVNLNFTRIQTNLILNYVKFCWFKQNFLHIPQNLMYFNQILKILNTIINSSKITILSNIKIKSPYIFKTIQSYYF